MDSLNALYEHCTLCPRRCGVNRRKGERGVCGMPADVLLSRISLHLWEEPCISGRCGSGTVFFAGCPMGCIYCQNASIVSGALIPGGGGDLPLAKRVDEDALSDRFLALQEAGAHNLNLVTATHFLPHVAGALLRARERGLTLPVIFNTSGYESVSSLRHLEGLADIYLTDFRYFDPATAAAYSKAPDYPERAREALAEMMRQTALSFDEEGLMRSGVIVRILLLPGHVREAAQILDELYGLYGNRLYFSLLRQYTPLPRTAGDPLLGRRVTKREYERLVDHALSLGIGNAYLQEGGAVGESFIPVFDGQVHLPENGIS